MSLYKLLDVKPPEIIDCWNCGKKFEKFRKYNPFTNTCKTCIINAWHIPLEDRKKYCKKPSFHHEQEKFPSIEEIRPIREESLKKSPINNILEINMNLNKKQLEMIKVCSQMDNSLRYALYHRIEVYDSQNEWLKYLKNW